MIELGEHADFIIAAYAGVAFVVVGLVGYVAIASRRVKARLAALEAQGIRRRSETQGSVR